MYDPEISERIQMRLNLLCEQRGTAAQVAKDTGINRTQIGRFLTGQSIPRADILGLIAETYDKPISWFFDREAESPETVSEHRVGAEFYSMLRGRRFQVDDRDIPQGLALFWKGMFTESEKFEAIISSIRASDAVCTIKSSMIAYLKQAKMFDHSDPIDHFCNGMILRSGAGYSLLFSDTRSNILITGYMERRLVTWSSNTFYSGYLVLNTSSALDGSELNHNVVPVVFEILPRNTKSVLGAARQRGMYDYADLPEYMQKLLEQNKVPEVNLMPR